MKQLFSTQGVVGILSSLVFTLTPIAGAANCDPAPSGLVGWWQGEGNALDAVGGNNGILVNGTGFTTGEVGNAFDLNGVNNYILVNPSLPSNLDVGQESGLTFEAWINPTTTNVQMPLFEYERVFGSQNAVDVGSLFYINLPSAGCLLANFPDTNDLSHQFGTESAVLTAGVWQHVALTYDKASGLASMYFNGSVVQQVNLGSFVIQTSFSNLLFGARTFYGSAAMPSDKFSGGFDEISLYNRALSAAEIAAIYEAGSAGKCTSPTRPTITEQPTNESIAIGGTTSFAVTTAGSAPLAYQWAFDGTNIVDATNATLTLADLQLSQAGDYSVTITNAYGATNSAVAVLNVFGLPPSITAEPTNQTVLIGGSTSFGITVSGTLPLSFQWSFDGTNIVGATSATLTLTGLQSFQAGNYSVSIANAYGSTNSTAAVLAVNPLPTCTPVPSGIAAWWQGEDNAFDAVAGNNGILENGTGFTNGEVGTAFWFNGIDNYVLVNPAAPSSLDVGQATGLTFEAWIKPTTIGIQMPLFEYERFLGSGSGPDVGALFYINLPQSGALMANFSDTNAIEHEINTSSGLITPNTWQHVALTYDKSSGLAVIYLNGSIVQQASLGTFVPQTSFTNLLIGARTFYGSASSPSDKFAGALDEVSLYNRALSASEVSAIYQSGSLGKCPAPPSIATQPADQTILLGGTATFAVNPGGTPPFAYQWSFDGTNITGATNAAFILADVQLDQAGSYAVQVSNSGGSTNSASAVLIVAIPPVITQQPQSLSVPSFGSASFGVAANGTGPLAYQWQINGTNLVDGGNFTGSTTTNLTIASVSPSDAGNYQVVVSSPYASTNSTVAILTVPETVISLGSTSALSGSTITVPVIINALGVESGFIGSVAYDPTKLVLQTIVGASPNYNQTNSGFIGFLAYPTVGDTFAPGSNTVVQLVFATLPVTNNTTVELTFANTPVNLQLTDNNFDVLPALYQGGTVQLIPAEYYADVYPRFNGDHQVNLQDWQEVGRMVAGLDVPTNSDEFLRADCAPRGSADGVLTVADWVQAGRYALNLDPLTIVTPPVNPGVVSKIKSKDGKTGPRIVQVGTVSAQRGQTVNVPISLICLTNENALGLTVSYNTNQLRFLAASLGSGLAGVRANINSNQVGKVGLALAVLPGVTLPAGSNHLAVLTFMARTTASGTAAVTLDSSVVKQQTADLLADSLPTTYINGAVVLPAQPTLGATMANGQLQFTWPLNSGTFQVQVADQPTGPWTTLTLPQINNGANATSVLTTTNQQQYFRLLGQ